ncbi:CoA pyrophosphatase [Glaesserella sp.]|uniref:NUDIX hydrolase n=1 Tax=Glaesserella sp. TaxID=2094731 RepID=UPI00359FFB73
MKLLPDELTAFLQFCQNPPITTSLMSRSELFESFQLSWRDAAVLVAFIPHSLHHWQLLLTRRQPYLSAHAGEIAFAGGKVDKGDENMAAAALRETWEEVGIAPNVWQIIGSLPLARVPSGFSITPVLAIAENLPPIQPNQAEVADVFCVPLEFILTESNFGVRYFTYRERQMTSPTLCYSGYEIWGITALMLKHLQECWQIWKQQAV